jgi:hypothetical protein
VCAIIRAPSAEEEDSRCTCRERETLIAERPRRINRIKGQGHYRLRIAATGAAALRLTQAILLASAVATLTWLGAASIGGWISANQGFSIPSISDLELRGDEHVSLVNCTTPDWVEIIWLFHLEPDICAECRLSLISC